MSKGWTKLYRFFETIGAIGAINWGALALGNLAGNNWNFVQLIAEGLNQPWVATTVYIIAGLGGLRWLDRMVLKGMLFKALGDDGK